MENLNAITSFFAQLWQVMSINHPVIGIPFSVIYLGIFAVGFGITILRPILGIGAGAVGDIKAGAKALRDRKIAQKNVRYNKSYNKYKQDRMRKEAYAFEYNHRTWR